jgi:hypothetical protein
MPTDARRRSLLLILLLTGLALCAGVGAYTAYRLEAADRREIAEIDKMLAPQRQKFREQQERRMRGELSPLARIDYVHLGPGDHQVVGGSGGPADIVVPRESLQPFAGQVRLSVSQPEGRLVLHAEPGVPVNGVPMDEGALKNGDVVALSQVRLLLAGLPGDPSVAVYDLNAPALRAYKGLHYYPDDSHYAVVGKLHPHPQPRPVKVESSRGPAQELMELGEVRFELRGRELALIAYGHDPRTLFILFKDPTNGRTTYGAGRFLYAPLGPEGRVLLDFNQAWNPLCAYSKYYHCPLPPRKNWLKIAIPVGEKSYGAH